MKVERIGLMVNDSNDSWECMRSVFGLLTENYWCKLFLLDSTVQLPPEMDEAEFVEHLEMFTEDMEADFFTTVKADAEKYPQLTLVTMDDMIPHMRDCQLLIPF